MHRLGWPGAISRGDLKLRPLSMRDEAQWYTVRGRNAEWLEPWEASEPTGQLPPRGFRGFVRAQRREARRATAMPLVIEWSGRFVGQITLGNVVWGSLRSGYIGYWVDSAVAGRGIATTSVAMLIDHVLAPGRLHRVEVNIRPENTASLRVVEKLGLRLEGERRSYLHIAGDWRDHLSFAITAGELPAGGLTAARPLAH